MLQQAIRLGERLFPERQILIRARGEVSHFAVSSTLQALMVVGFVGAAGATTVIGFTSSRAVAVASVHADIAAQEAAAAELELAALNERVKALQDQLESATQKGNSAQGELDRIASEQAKLKAEKGKLQHEVGSLEKDKDKIAKLAAAERASMRQKLGELQQRMIKVGRGANTSTVAVPTQGEGDAEPDVARPVGAQSGNFDINRFLGQFGLSTRQADVGGPFIPVGAAEATDHASTERARKAMETLPLTAPLDNYRLESGFGVRSDPFNNRHSMHQTPVHSTAPGQVTFAGYAAAYGKMVEIDHGNGVRTRYAHLNRITVTIGQHVTKHMQVGLLGSTGRSTGPHCHYEVLVDGIAQDPAKFLEAGRNIIPVKAKE
jgi:murein DD-endopeptidase MepM/ murein hydrolase activator NlpD